MNPSDTTTGRVIVVDIPQSRYWHSARLVDALAKARPVSRSR